MATMECILCIFGNQIYTYTVAVTLLKLTDTTNYKQFNTLKLLIVDLLNKRYKRDC
jgi:hypothetical protein